MKKKKKAGTIIIVVLSIIAIFLASVLIKQIYEKKKFEEAQRMERIQKAKEHSDQFVKAVEEKDMKNIQEIIFNFEKADGYIPNTEENEEEDDSLVEYIVDREVMTVKSIDEKQILYEFDVPDLENIFIQLMEKEEYTDKKFKKYIKDYIENAPIVKKEIPVKYMINNNGEIEIDYYTEEFIDAFTGGLLEAYQGMYDQMLEEYER